MRSLSVILALLCCAFSANAISCEILADLCRNGTVSPTCNATFTTMNSVCAPVNNGSWSQHYCPAGCRQAITAYADETSIYLNNANLTTLDYCQCTSQNCQNATAAFRRLHCIAPGCHTVAQQCASDPTCLTTLNTLNAECATVFNGSWTQPFCPAACQTSLNAYVGMVAPNASTVGFCECGAGDTVCVTNKQRALQVGCYQENCLAQTAECQSRPNCNRVFNNYIGNCSQVFSPSGNPLDYCPAECQAAFDIYLQEIAPNRTGKAICDCQGDPSCTAGRLALFTAGCIGNTCAEQKVNCDANPICVTKRMKWKADCATVLSPSYNQTVCTPMCKASVLDYLKYTSTSRTFCDCAGDQACMAEQAKLKQLGCAPVYCPKLGADCNADPTCDPILQSYLQECASQLNGSWTQPWCPSNCKSGLVQFLSAAQVLEGLTTPDFDSICDCYNDTFCEQPSQNLKNANCYSPRDCVTQAVVCQNDPQCLPNFQSYIRECEAVWNGTLTQCPYQCQFQLGRYVTQLGGSLADLNGFCSCGLDQTCSVNKGRMIAAGCSAVNCIAQAGECSGNSTCKPIMDAYVTACSDVWNQTWIGNTCPTNCASTLDAYLKYLYGNRTFTSFPCDCGTDAQCLTNRQRLLDIGCISFAAVNTPTAAPAMSPLNPPGGAPPPATSPNGPPPVATTSTLPLVGSAKVQLLGSGITCALNFATLFATEIPSLPSNAMAIFCTPLAVARRLMAGGPGVDLRADFYVAQIASADALLAEYQALAANIDTVMTTRLGVTPTNVTLQSFQCDAGSGCLDSAVVAKINNVNTALNLPQIVVRTAAPSQAPSRSPLQAGQTHAPTTATTIKTISRAVSFGAGLATIALVVMSLLA